MLIWKPTPERLAERRVAKFQKSQENAARVEPHVVEVVAGDLLCFDVLQGFSDGLVCEPEFAALVRDNRAVNELRSLVGENVELMQTGGDVIRAR